MSSHVPIAAAPGCQPNAKPPKMNHQARRTGHELKDLRSQGFLGTSLRIFGNPP